MGHLADYKFIYKENMDIYLQALNDCIYSKYGLVKVSLMIVGGSALILGHRFRISTEDIDAHIVSGGLDIQTCINTVSSMFSIPEDWLNSSFVNSPSFSPNLGNNAEFCHSYGVLDVYKVSDLDLICMKLISFRDKDEEDLRGLLTDCYVTQEMISDRLIFLYGNNIFNKMKQEAIYFVRYNVKRI